jgi:hypothetical protein
MAFYNPLYMNGVVIYNSIQNYTMILGARVGSSINGDGSSAMHTDSNPQSDDLAWSWSLLPLDVSKKGRIPDVGCSRRGAWSGVYKLTMSVATGMDDSPEALPHLCRILSNPAV